MNRKGWIGPIQVEGTGIYGYGVVKLTQNTELTQIIIIKVFEVNHVSAVAHHITLLAVRTLLRDDY